MARLRTLRISILLIDRDLISHAVRGLPQFPDATYTRRERQAPSQTGGYLHSLGKLKKSGIVTQLPDSFNYREDLFAAVVVIAAKTLFIQISQFPHLLIDHNRDGFAAVGIGMYV